MFELARVDGEDVVGYKDAERIGRGLFEIMLGEYGWGFSGTEC